MDRRLPLRGTRGTRIGIVRTFDISVRPRIAVALSVGGLVGSALVASPIHAENWGDETLLALATKSMCDQSVPGFKERSAAAYAEWREGNLEAVQEIERKARQEMQGNPRAAASPAKVPLTPQQQAEMASLCNAFLAEQLHAPDPRLGDPEKTWTTFLEAMKNADRKLAVSCLTGNATKNYRGRILEKYSDAQLKAMAGAFTHFRVTLDLGKIREATIARRDGKAGIITFHLVGREWKISEL